MQLVIDFGNTLQKIAIFNENELLEVKTFKGISTGEFISYLNSKAPFDAAIISSVIDFPDEILNYLNKLPRFINLSPETALPFKNLYETPQSLGRDRIALAAAATGIYPGRNVLVIDAGTCITFDMVNSKGEYLGGAISPGIHMRFRAMHTFTGKLPLIEPEDFTQLIGRSTRESMLSGVMNGIVAEIDGIITRYSESFDDLAIILSGGDHKILYNKLKSNIFAIPDLLVRGLKIILDYNE